MPLDAALLEILACPKCKGELEYRVGEGEEAFSATRARCDTRSTTASRSC